MTKTTDQQLFRRLLIRNVSLPLVLSLLSCAIFVGIIFYLVDTNNWVDHTSQVVSAGYKLEKRLVDAETGLRGFVIAANEEFLEPYSRSTTTLPQSFRALKDLVKDNPAQVAKLEVMEEVYDRWQNYAQTTIEMRKKNRGAALDIVAQGNGKAMMDEIRSLVTEFVSTEESLRAARTQASNSATRITLGVVIGFTLIVGTVIAMVGRRQLTMLADTYEGSLKTQLEQNEKLEDQRWVDIGRTEINQRMLGDLKIVEAADAILNYLAEYLGAQVGMLYVADEQNIFECKSSYAVVDKAAAQKVQFKMGETLLGQAAQSKKMITLQEIPPDYLKIKTGLGDKRPKHVILVPFSSDGSVNVVAELGFYAPLHLKATEFLEDASAAISVAMKSAAYREKLERLYRDVQNQAEELQAQQEELRVSNEELEEQTKLLKEAQTRLESQHAELEQTNSQLEEQTEELEKQKETLSLHNEELNQAREELERRAAELGRASQYKSEFLANMSHELRTPLNSSLILAKLLADNKERNLTPKQVEFAQQIMTSGNDLLNLINDILDLAKVESGKLDIHAESMKTESVLEALSRTFNPIARDKGIEFNVKVADGSPDKLTSDRQRLEQILKNLLSNAMKFTHKGKVELLVQSVGNSKIEFKVTDTGIGIAKEQQELIFEAFRQADGTDSRKYSGTGLGLSISKDLAGLLGGLIQVQSEPGQGSSFSLVIPITYEGTQANARTTITERPLSTPSYSTLTSKAKPSQEKSRPLVPTMFKDDREKLAPNENVVLIVEDDDKFAKILFDIAHESEFKALVAGTADDAMDLASAYNVNAILLDINLPDHSGLFVLDHLKQSAKTRHIPVHVISGFDFSQQAMQMGAIGYMLKPVKRDQLKGAFSKIEAKIQQDIKKVLIVEDDKIQREAIVKLIEDKQIKATSVGFAKEGLEKLASESFDCLIMDLSLPDMSGFEFLDHLAEHENYSHPPVIVYTGRDLSRDEEEKLRRHSQSLIIKGASSPDRLLNEVTLFLHKVESKLEPERQKMLESLRNREKTFDKKIVMVVDDDIRNVFALTAALEQKGAQVVIARDGQEALGKLKEEARVDFVLMDIMMPVMNGYEAMREIRKQARFAKLPIIALTAKAMKDDRELCLNAGANDYLAKPVDIEKLISLMRIWMSYGEGKRSGQ